MVLFDRFQKRVYGFDDFFPSIIQELSIILKLPQLRVGRYQLRSQSTLTLFGYDVLWKVVRWRVVQDVSVRFASDERHVGNLIDFLFVVSLLLQQRLWKDMVILKFVGFSYMFAGELYTGKPVLGSA